MSLRETPACFLAGLPAAGTTATGTVADFDKALNASDSLHEALAEPFVARRR